MNDKLIDQNQRISSSPQKFQLKLIQSTFLYPFAINEVTNQIQLTYTCLIDRKTAQKHLGIQLIGGYRKITLIKQENKQLSTKNNYRTFKQPQRQNQKQSLLLKSQQKQKQQKQSSNHNNHNNNHNNNDFNHTYQNHHDNINHSVVILIIVVDGLGDREKGSKTQNEQKNKNINHEDDEQMEQYFGSDKKIIEQCHLQNICQNQSQLNLNINRSQSNTQYYPNIYAPYNIYKHFHRIIASQSHIQQPIYVNIQRFPISLTRNLRVESYNQIIQKIIIYNFTLPIQFHQQSQNSNNKSNNKTINQLKNLITKIIINPKYHSLLQGKQNKNLHNSVGKQSSNKKSQQQLNSGNQYQFYIFLFNNQFLQPSSTQNPHQPNKSSSNKNLYHHGIKSITYSINMSTLTDLNNENSWLFKWMNKNCSTNTKNQLLEYVKQNFYDNRDQQTLDNCNRNSNNNLHLKKKNSIQNYIEFTVSVQVDKMSFINNKLRNQPYILKFVPGKTVLEFQKEGQENLGTENSTTTELRNNQKQKTLNQVNLTKSPLFAKKITLSPIYQQIFQIQNELYKNIANKLLVNQEKSFYQSDDSHKQDQFICLKADSNIGLQFFFHHLAQQCLQHRFVLVDCQSFVSQKQFYKFLKQIPFSQGYNSFIVIKNIPWLQNLSKLQDIAQQPLKSIIQKIFTTIKTSYQNTLNNFICVLYFSQGSLPQQLPHIAKRWQYTLKKQTKIQILKKIFNFYYSHYSNVPIISSTVQQTIINILSNSYGWQKIYQFLLQFQLEQLSQMKQKQIIKIIQKQFRLENVQNVAEVSWDDIGGLQTAKQEIIQTVLLPTKHPEIFDQLIKPRTGLLFYGPPGTGKTLLGKCIAKECKMSFISIKGPQLLNMYVGQSEKNVRQIFQRAKQCKPCIVFMDELDALVPKRGNNNDSNAVMDRIVAQLLIQMDTASQNGIFIIGATNRPDLLDPSILRTGRFDKQIYLGISKNKQDRIKILKAQTRNSLLADNFNYQSIIQKVPQNFTGADFYGLTSKAMMKAVERSIQKYQNNQDNDQNVIITQQDFQQVLPLIKPSVSQQQLKHYQSLKQKFS